MVLSCLSYLMLYRQTMAFYCNTIRKKRWKNQINSFAPITNSTEELLLTSQHFNNQIHISTEFLDMIKVCYCHYWHILITVHLWYKVHVTGKIFSVGRKKIGKCHRLTLSNKLETKIHHIVEGRFLLHFC